MSNWPTSGKPLIGIVAGEISGDRLGAGLMKAVSERLPEARFCGVGGVAMLDAGLQSVLPMEQLAAQGFVEPLLRLPKLLRSYRTLCRRFVEEPVDLFIGIDFNVFNGLLERRVHAADIPVMHYVSPSVYAWRSGRAAKLAAYVDQILTLFPFEPAYYDGLPITATYVGHPLADQLSPIDQRQAQTAVGIDVSVEADSPIVALLPGSRRSEVERLGPLFFSAAARIMEIHPQARFLVACAHSTLAARLRSLCSEAGLPDRQVTIVTGDTANVMSASDVVLTKSGTSTLEALLLQRPMVVAYRLDPISYQIVRALIHTPFIALPNILAREQLVPEFVQHEATAVRLAEAVMTQWQEEQQQTVAAQSRAQQFAVLADRLRRNADEQAARAVVQALARFSGVDITDPGEWL